jgi:hypothetical protein
MITIFLQDNYCNTVTQEFRQLLDYDVRHLYSLVALPVYRFGSRCNAYVELSERLACSGMNGTGRLGGAGPNVIVLNFVYQLPTLLPGALQHTTAGP